MELRWAVKVSITSYSSEKKIYRIVKKTEKKIVSFSYSVRNSNDAVLKRYQIFGQLVICWERDEMNHFRLSTLLIGNC